MIPREYLGMPAGWLAGACGMRGGWLVDAAQERRVGGSRRVFVRQAAPAATDDVGHIHRGERLLPGIRIPCCAHSGAILPVFVSHYSPIRRSIASLLSGTSYNTCFRIPLSHKSLRINMKSMD